HRTRWRSHRGASPDSAIPWRTANDRTHGRDEARNDDGRDRMRRKAIAAALGTAWALVGMVVSAAPARASFPGSNGLIVWSRLFVTRDAELFDMNPDASGEMPLTHNDRTDFDPAWSADGTD